MDQAKKMINEAEKHLDQAKFLINEYQQIEYDQKISGVLFKTLKANGKTD